MLLRATGLGRRIGDAWIGRGVEVQLQADENLTILGSIGAGKSLLLRCLAGLDAAGEGEIAVRRRFAGVYWSSLVSVSGSAFFVTGLALVGIIRVEPWFAPQYLIPFLGMVLGNTLNGISLALDRFVESLVQRRDAVEAVLALGVVRVGRPPTSTSVTPCG